MAILGKIALVVLVHVAFFASYPDTGPFGNIYLAISMLLWTGFTLFMGTAIKVIRLFSGILGLLLNLSIFLVMSLTVAATMPQTDKTSVLEKIQLERYPARDTLNRGLQRFGINLDLEIEKGVNELNKQAQKAVKKI